MVDQFMWNGENTIIDLSKLATGVYIMKVSNKDKFEVKKLIVR